MSESIPSVAFAVEALAWDKQNGLLPAVVQDADTLRVLMLGYMDRAALAATLASGRVTFYSRSKQRLWTKGESSGHVLELVAIVADCDGDALLVRARPHGPTCHRGTPSCFDAAPTSEFAELDAIVARRRATPRNCSKAASPASPRKSARKASKSRSPRSPARPPRSPTRRPIWSTTSPYCSMHAGCRCARSAPSSRRGAGAGRKAERRCQNGSMDRRSATRPRAARTSITARSRWRRAGR